MRISDWSSDVCSSDLSYPFSICGYRRMSVTIYHNPRCSKSRNTLELLRDRGIEPTIVEYLATPPDAAELKRILGLLGMSPRDLMRRGEAAYGENSLDAPALDDNALIAAMVASPILIERPLVVVKDEKQSEKRRVGKGCSSKVRIRR